MYPGRGEAGAAYNTMRNDYVFGVLWADEALSLRERSQVVVAGLCVSNRTGQLSDYVRAALVLGCDATELEEIFLTAAIYCGVAPCEEGLLSSMQFARVLVPAVKARDRHPERMLTPDSLR